jgi:capsular exopolysaccharide synthesis family protein
LFFTVQNSTVVADQLLKDLKVNSVSKLSTTINLTYQVDVAEKGEAILNELLRQYLRSSVENENVLATNTLIFVEDRLRDVERELDSIERRTQQFRVAENVIDLSEQGHIFLESVAETDRRIVEINAQLAALEQVARYVNGEGSGISIVPTTLGIEDPVLAELLQRLNTLELERANLGTTTGENNPLIRSVDNEIQKIRPNIRSIVNNQRARLRASRNNLAGTSGQLNSTLRAIPQKERELLEISRQQAVKRDLYAFLLQRREEAALSSASAIAENRVVDWADANIATRGSKTVFLLVGSLVAAFALGIAYILVREDVNGKILFRTQVEELTSLAVIGEVAYRSQRRIPFPQSSTDAVLAKAFSQMQAALGLYNDENRNRRFLVTSSLLMEGSSFVANHFAIYLARTGKKVLLADLNLYSPDTSRLHQLQQRKGFADFVQQPGGPEPFIHASGFPNLDVLPAGSQTANPVPLLLHPKTGGLFTFLASHYDYVVVDAPPVELTTDAFTLSKFCDCSLLVVRHNTTPKNLVKKLDANPGLQTLPRLHIVLNGIKARGFPGRFYGYGYGYGYESIPKKQLAKLV